MSTWLGVMTHLQKQSVLTCAAPLSPGTLSEVSGYLVALRKRGVNGNLESIENLHFARVALLPGARDCNGHFLPPSLVFSSWHDGARDAHIHALSERAGDFMGTVLQHCDGFRRDCARDGAIRDFLYRHSAPSLAEFNVAPLRTLRQIRLEQGLVTRLRGMIENNSRADCDAILEELRRRVSSDPELRWALERSSHFPPSAAEKALRWLAWLCRTAPLWLRFFVSLRALRRDERANRESAPNVDLPPRLPRALVQNDFNLITTLRPGQLRQRVLTLFLDLVNLIASMHTDLAGLTTVRFAHWSPLDGGRRLLFCSVFDSSFESYISDIIGLAGWGLTGIWSNMVGFPPADWLVLNGATDERPFRAFLRQNEVQSSFSYSAHPRLSCDHITNAARVRDGLSSVTSPNELEAWLSFF